MPGRHRGADGRIDKFSVSHGIVVSGYISGAVSKRRLGKAAVQPTAPTESVQSPAASHIDLDHDQVLARTTEVVGSKDEAIRWLETPVRALGYATPMSLLVDKTGTDQVLALLDNLEHGVL